MKRTFLLLFLAGTIGVLISRLVDHHGLHVMTKPLIMSSLMFYYLSAADKVNRSGVVLIAIACSLAGDLLLINPRYFIPGLLAFLVAHVFYIFAYRQHRSDESTDALRGVHRIRLAFPIVLAGAGLIVILYPAIEEYRVPVIVYALIITIMALTALSRFGRTSQESFWLVFGGAILFMISDSLIAIDKFLMPVSQGGFFILLTYAAAQFMIVSGLIKHEHE